MGAFRDFLEELREQGELRTISDPISWDLEAAAICAMAQRVGEAAVEFNNVRGYPNARLVGGTFVGGPGFMNWPQVRRFFHGRIALALGLDLKVRYDELLETIIDRRRSPVRAMEVESGPAQEVVIEGRDVDLLSYPIPKIHERDGGRYLTHHVILTRDPEVGWTNAATYRLMVVGRNRLVHGSIPNRWKPTRHLESMVRKAHQRGQPLPFAIVIGAPPPLTMGACLQTPEATDEFALAGSLGISPLVLVKAKLSDILVPADAEIILEGHIYPGERALEGPFGSISYYTEPMESFVYRVELITQRKDPILPFVAEGAKPSDTMCLFSVMHSAELLELERTFGVPAKWVSIPVETKLTVAAVSLSYQPVAAIPNRAAHLIFANSPFVRKVVVVDGDVHPHDTMTLFRDMGYKAHIERDWYISQGPPISAGLTENFAFGTNLSGTVCVDATWRVDKPAEDIPRRVQFNVCFPPEVRERVIKLWNEELRLPEKGYPVAHDPYEGM